MPDPYTFVRGLTIGLATLWTLGGLWRMFHFASRWKSRLVPLGFSEEWIHRQALIFTLRATLLDPINLSLILLLFLTWSLRLQV